MTVLFTEQYDSGIAPEFIVPVKPKAVKSMETVELRCVVSGTPMPTVVWCRGDEQIEPDDSHVISYLPETGESKLTICNATKLDVNDYTVKAVNNYGMAQCKANLIIGRVFRFNVIIHIYIYIILLNNNICLIFNNNYKLTINYVN